MHWEFSVQLEGLVGDGDGLGEGEGITLLATIIG